MKIIRRHIQSITLVVIAGLLLAFAFYISQQTRPGRSRTPLTVTPHPEGSTLDDLPACAGLDDVEQSLVCHAEAVQVSEMLMLAVVDEIMLMEPEPALRVAFMEAQIAWEEWRNAECAFLRGLPSDQEGHLGELICLTDMNLTRHAALEAYHQAWYCPEGCTPGAKREN